LHFSKKIMNKKSIAIIFTTIAVVSLVCWYLFPYYSYKWFIFSSIEFRKYLEMPPVYIDELAATPQEWSRIIIGNVSFKIPLNQAIEINSSLTNQIFFKFESGCLLISDIAPTKDFVEMLNEEQIPFPFIPYDDQVAVYNSNPSDVSIINSRSKNWQGCVNQTLKFLSVPNGVLYEIAIINPEILKALCTKLENGKCEYTAFATIYNQNENFSFSIMLKNLTEKKMLDLQLLQILNGIIVQDQPSEIEKVEKDIKAIIDQYNNKI